VNEKQQGRFILVPEVRWSVRDSATGTEVLHCGSESLADWWAEQLEQQSSNRAEPQ
jgi:hypothetical protein